MKIYVRLIALMLCAVMLFAFASCARSAEDVPEGMQLVSCAGADYRLYVPTSWVANTTYGVSGAYRSLDKQSTVSVMSYDTGAYAAQLTEAGISPEDTEARIQWFWEAQCLEPVKSRALDQQVTYDEGSGEGLVYLGGAKAKEYRYHGVIQTAERSELYFLQVVAERNSRFYVFTFTATAEMYEMYLSEVKDSIIAQFQFAEPYVPLMDDQKKLDDGANAPAGMKSAFGDDVAYCFYVPQSWVIDANQSIYAAYVAEDKTSVSVTPYMPDVAAMSVREYFNMSRSMMESMSGVNGFEMLSETGDADLGGRVATVYEYRLSVGGTIYRYRQYIAAYKSMIYCLTYTATEEAFGLHLEELNSIVDAFQFR